MVGLVNLVPAVRLTLASVPKICGKRPGSKQLRQIIVRGRFPTFWSSK